MIAVNLNELELNEFTAKEDASQHCKATFPLVGAHGSEKIATVYIELEPGKKLGRHTDSAEELLVVLSGEVEISVNDERQHVSENEIALVPRLAPHNIRNVGKRKARILGVFGGSNHIVATFEKEWSPTNSNVVDTSLLFEA